MCVSIGNSLVPSLDNCKPSAQAKLLLVMLHASHTYLTFFGPTLFFGQLNGQLWQNLPR